LTKRIRKKKKGKKKEMKNRIMSQPERGMKRGIRQLVLRLVIYVFFAKKKSDLQTAGRLQKVKRRKVMQDK